MSTLLNKFGNGGLLDKDWCDRMISQITMMNNLAAVIFRYTDQPWQELSS